MGYTNPIRGTLYNMSPEVCFFCGGDNFNSISERGNYRGKLGQQGYVCINCGAEYYSYDVESTKRNVVGEI